MGNDPRFNSIHLESNRRQDYRRAREGLIQACGQLNLAESLDDVVSHTYIQNHDHVPTVVDHWLAENDCIYPLHPGFNTLGRSSDNDVVVEDLYISRRHCTLFIHHDHTCELHDMASKNGTLINGKKLNGPTRLYSGDTIRICARVFTYKCRMESSQLDDQTLAV